ncbi:MAG: MerR family transcriptional regulator [Pseudomonadota bacterium]
MTGPKIPDKVYFKIGEAASIVGVEPHVLRFWESEFPQVRPTRAPSKQRLYTRRELETFLLIKKLLYDEQFTISGAKKKLRSKVAAPEELTLFSHSHRELLVEVRQELLDIKKILG